MDNQENFACGEFVHISTGLTGKMKDIPAITTSKTMNDFCKKCSSKHTTICNKCYADRALSCYKGARTRFENNSRILSKKLMTWQIPRTMPGIMRLETHGELINAAHLQNYITICEANPWTCFTLWTKRVDLLREIAKTRVQPNNLNVKISSPIIGQKSKVSKEWFSSKGWNVTLFTVYTLEQAKANNVEITCGGRSCASCMKCYGNHEQTDIVELLKQDMSKAKRVGFAVSE